MFAGLGCFLGLAGVIGLLLMNSAFFDISGGSGEVLFQKPIGTLFGYVFELTLDTRHLQLSLGIAAAVGVSSLGVGRSEEHTHTSRSSRRTNARPVWRRCWRAGRSSDGSMGAWSSARAR
jgi:hypothetical protein